MDIKKVFENRIKKYLDEEKVDGEEVIKKFSEEIAEFIILFEKENDVKLINIDFFKRGLDYKVTALIGKERK